MLFRQESYIWNWATQENIHGFHICCRFLIHAQNQLSNWTVWVCLQNMPLIGGDTLCVFIGRDVSVVFCVFLWSTRGGVFSQTSAVVSETQKWLVSSSLPVSITVGWLTHRKTDRAHKPCCPLLSPGSSVDARFRSTKIHKASLNSLFNSRVALSYRVNCYDFYLWK